MGGLNQAEFSILKLKAMVYNILRLSAFALLNSICLILSLEIFYDLILLFINIY